MCQHSGMEMINLNRLGYLFLIALMVGHRVVCIAETEFRISPVAHLVTNMKGTDAGHVALPGDVLGYRSSDRSIPRTFLAFPLAPRAPADPDQPGIQPSECAARYHAPRRCTDRSSRGRSAAVVCEASKYPPSRHPAAAILNQAGLARGGVRETAVAKEPFEITLGRFSIGNGVVSLRHEIVL